MLPSWSPTLHGEECVNVGSWCPYSWGRKTSLKINVHSLEFLFLFLSSILKRVCVRNSAEAGFVKSFEKTVCILPSFNTVS